MGGIEEVLLVGIFGVGHHEVHEKLRTDGGLNWVKSLLMVKVILLQSKKIMGELERMY